MTYPCHACNRDDGYPICLMDDRCQRTDRPPPPPTRKSDTMTDLKPCPFCGARPLLYDLFDTHGGFSVECPTDGCDTEKMKRTKAEAVAAWNRRAALPGDDGDDGGVR